MKKFFAAALGSAILMTAGMSAAEAGPSFNCRYAKQPAEQAVCDYRGLSRMDRTMSKLYHKTMRKALDKNHLRRLQRNWLSERNSCGYNPGCIRRAYRKQIRFFRYW